MRFGMIKDGRGTLRDVQRKPEFSETYDIAVVGLGTAGAPALEKSVSLGRKCLGIERAGGMGGQATVGCICWGSGAVTSLASFERNCAAAEVVYEAVPVGVWLDGGKIVGLRYARNGIVSDVKVGVVLDATGNATVAKMCGLPVRRGRDFDGVMATCARGETWVDRTTGAMRPEYCGRPESLAGGACDPVVKGAYPNRVKAILLLGRFADAEIAKTLKAIVLDNADGFMKDLYGKGAWKSPELCRFQALSYALMALKSILAKHPDEAMSAEIADWQAHRAPAMAQPEGVDFRDRLRHVSFKS